MILVAGATSTVGRELIKRLAKLGLPVRVLVRNPTKANINKVGVEAVTGDLAKPETLDAAFNKVEKTFLLFSDVPNQVEMECNFIDAAKRVHVSYFVRVSVIGADVNSPKPSFKAQGLIERYLEEAGVPFTNLRPSSFMQNMTRFATTIKSEGAFYLPLKDVQAGLIDNRDIAAVAAVALTQSGHEGKTYTLTGPELLTYTQVAQKLSAAIGKPIKYVDVSSEEFKQRLINDGALEEDADKAVDRWSETGDGYFSFITNDVAEVTKKSATTFDQFAHDYAHVFK